MTGRWLVMMVALAVLILTGIGNNQAAIPHSQSHGASGQFADAAASEADVPAIGAAVSTSATIQTHLVARSQHALRPAVSVVLVSPRLPVVRPSTAKPRVFPLLI